MKTKRTCPYCDGKGYMYLEHSVARHVPVERKKEAFDLRKKGFTFREIGERLNITSPQNVKFYIESYIKHNL